ncbi:hypothetical protein CGLO_18008 [Colletotrichum gloeosporioides Cg-14]|uniref:Uncharacterized protein n=1 Tax=Colletotrichum gloeosporioides (strain Cg-14) TaxID=1237896 RepID=T0L532_COLGC|nr:hypothetical protein CGLO_18008 [Colletotrichum gloeosporioides Cg-14]
METAQREKSLYTVKRISLSKPIVMLVHPKESRFQESWHPSNKWTISH